MKAPVGLFYFLFFFEINLEPNCWKMSKLMDNYKTDKPLLDRQKTKDKGKKWIYQNKNRTTAIQKELNTIYPHIPLPLWTHKHMYSDLAHWYLRKHPTTVHDGGDKRVQTTATLETSSHNQHNLPSSHPVNLSQVCYCSKRLSTRLLMLYADLKL